MKIAAAVLAAGQGARFGGDKLSEDLDGRPVWRHSADLLEAHSNLDEVFVVVSADNDAEVSKAGFRTVRGGATRTASTRAAVAATDADVLLIHDAARPFLTAKLVDRVLDAVLKHGAAAPVIPVSDTIRLMADDGPLLLDRKNLRAMQTPQGARTEHLRLALVDGADATDDVALLEAAGIHVALVEGDVENIKITHAADLVAARARFDRPSTGVETRVGFGYDVHRFSQDPARALWLGGIHFPDQVGLDGHSDADALLHAVTDALLGAATLGDIGVHFPNDEPQWSGAASHLFLSHAGVLLTQAGWTIVHLDVTVVAERPKVMPRAFEMREAIAHALDVAIDRVSIKATTNERMGFVGREEGIAATAVATIRRA